MDYTKRFKSHKIRNVDLSVCNCEQKIAYNYLFSWTINERDKTYILSCIQSDLSRRSDMDKYDKDLIYHYILQNFSRYIEAGRPIFGDFESLGKFIKSDFYKA